MSTNWRMCTSPKKGRELVMVELFELLEVLYRDRTETNEVHWLMSWDIRRLKEFIPTVGVDKSSTKHSFAPGDPGYDLLLMFPFKSDECKHPFHCCGMCTRRCSFRCPMDLLTRLYDLGLKVKHEPEELTILERMVLARVERYDTCPSTLEEAESLYADMCDHVGIMIYRQEPLKKIDYAPLFDYYVDKEGNYRIRAEAVTGKRYLRVWPYTGLCPHCLPPATHDRKVGRRKRVDSVQEDG